MKGERAEREKCENRLDCKETESSRKSEKDEYLTEMKGRKWRSKEVLFDVGERRNEGRV